VLADLTRATARGQFTTQTTQTTLDSLNEEAYSLLHDTMSQKSS
jgi:hypothetical protein